MATRLSAATVGALEAVTAPDRTTSVLVDGHEPDPGEVICTETMDVLWPLCHVTVVVPPRNRAPVKLADDVAPTPFGVQPVTVTVLDARPDSAAQAIVPGRMTTSTEPESQGACDPADGRGTPRWSVPGQSGLGTCAIAGLPESGR